MRRGKNINTNKTSSSSEKLKNVKSKPRHAIKDWTIGSENQIVQSGSCRQ